MKPLANWSGVIFFSVLSLSLRAQGVTQPTWALNGTGDTEYTTSHVLILAPNNINNTPVGNTIPFVVSKAGLTLTGSAKYSFRISDPNYVAGFVIGYDATNLTGILGAQGGNSLAFWAGTDAGHSERMRVAVTGEILIATTGATSTTNPNNGIKLDVNGDIKAAGSVIANGNIAAKYQDVAEWVPATEGLRPGTVVVLNLEQDNAVVASAHAYDTAVAGVVSANPGVILGESSKLKAQIATSGRVLVHVSAARQPIKIGDLLVTSETPGVAMKSEPIELSGFRIHRPGTIVGKALQALSAGQGDILVLLSLQ